MVIPKLYRNSIQIATVQNNHTYIHSHALTHTTTHARTCTYTVHVQLHVTITHNNLVWKIHYNYEQLYFRKIMNTFSMIVRVVTNVTTSYNLGKSVGKRHNRALNTNRIWMILYTLTIWTLYMKYQLNVFKKCKKCHIIENKIKIPKKWNAVLLCKTHRTLRY